MSASSTNSVYLGRPWILPTVCHGARPADNSIFEQAPTVLGRDDDLAMSDFGRKWNVNSIANRLFLVESPNERIPVRLTGAGTLDDVIARSKKSSDVQNNIAPGLPEVARIPTRKRTYHISHEDLETRVRPLLSCHWHIGRVGNVVDDPQVFSLNKLFSFRDFRSAVEFFDALADVQDEEDHHARVTVDYSNVHIATHTHVAYERTSDTDAEPKPIKVPGLTARDIRFAVKVEALHGEFLDAGRAVTKAPFDSAGLQAWSMEQLQRRYSTSHGQETGGTSMS